MGRIRYRRNATAITISLDSLADFSGGQKRASRGFAKLSTLHIDWRDHSTGDCGIVSHPELGSLEQRIMRLPTKPREWLQWFTTLLAVYIFYVVYVLIRFHWNRDNLPNLFCLESKDLSGKLLLVFGIVVVVFGNFILNRFSRSLPDELRATYWRVFKPPSPRAAVVPICLGLVALTELVSWLVCLMRQN